MVGVAYSGKENEVTAFFKKRNNISVFFFISTLNSFQNMKKITPGNFFCPSFLQYL